MWPLILVLDGPCPWQGHQFHWSWCHWSWLGHGLLAHGGLVEAMAFPWRIEPMVCHIWFKWLCHGFCCTISMTGTQWHCNVVPIDGSLAHTTWTSLWLLVWKAVGRPHASKLAHAPLSGAPWAGTWPAGSCMQKKTLRRVIPTMTFIRFVTGKSSGILSDISSGILSGLSSGILSGISSGILPGISSAICSGISSDILSGKHSGISSGILSDILSGVLSGISSGILSGRWSPAVPTELGRSQVEVQRCPLSSEGRRLGSSIAHWARKVPGWGPAVPTALRTWRLRSSRAHSDRKPAVEVQQCPLRAEVGEEIGKELARRKWTWKLMQTWSRRNWRRRKRRRMRRTALIKSNKPHLAGGEQHSTKLGMKHWVLVHGNQLHIQNPHESSGCYMDMVEQAKQHGSNAQQNEHESTMCSTAGNTHFCTCSCGHGGLEVTKAWVIAPVGHIPEVVLVALVYVHWPWLWPWQELGCLIVHPQLMEDSKVDPPVPVALLQSWCLWLWPWEWCHHLGHLQLVPATAYGTGNKCQQMAM